MAAKDAGGVRDAIAAALAAEPGICLTEVMCVVRATLQQVRVRVCARVRLCMCLCGCACVWKCVYLLCVDVSATQLLLVGSCLCTCVL